MSRKIEVEKEFAFSTLQEIVNEHLLPDDDTEEMYNSRNSVSFNIRKKFNETVDLGDLNLERNVFYCKVTCDLDIKL